MLGEFRLNVDDLEPELQTLRYIRDAVLLEAVTRVRITASTLVHDQEREVATTRQAGG